MRILSILWVIVVMGVFGNVGDVGAYGDSSGGSNSTNACSKVKFSKFTPDAYTQSSGMEVAPKSDFSFFASKEIAPKSIAVTIKGQSVPITVTPKNNGFEVTGVLPDTIKGTYARIKITAKGPNHQCERNDGWLLKVAD